MLQTGAKHRKFITGRKGLHCVGGKNIILYVASLFDGEGAGGGGWSIEVWCRLQTFP